MRAIVTPLRALRSAATIASIAVFAVPAGGSEITDLRAQVDKLVAPLLIANADIRAKVHQSLLTKTMNYLSGLPAENKSASFTMQSRSGPFYNVDRGFAGCGAFAEVEAASIKIVLNSLQTNWQTDGTLAAVINATVNISGRVHGHIHGLGGPICGCSCKIGGGAGVRGSIAANASAPLQGYLTFAPGPAADIAFAVFITGPDAVGTQGTATIEGFPSLPFNASVPVPKAQLASGHGFGLFRTQGKLRVGNNHRSYTLDVTNPELKSDSSGLDLRAKVAVRM